VQAPRADEFEISIFGPGRGECIVAHLGGGDWVIVDSCIDRESGRPAAIRYLSDIAVDIAHSVKLFIVTHWHDDHMRGASKVLEEAEAALFVCSDALRSKEFLTLASCGSGTTPSYGVKEFYAILETLKSRLLVREAGPNWALHDKRIFQRHGLGTVPLAEVWSLSPSSAGVTLAKKEIAELLPPELAPKTAIHQSANDVAVALLVQVGAMAAVLGSDLQADTGPNRGWQAVLASPNRPQVKARVLKVPHHGSKNADHPGVWQQMLEPSPFALLTPFSSGISPLPTETDRQRLLGRTPNLFCTARATSWAPPRRSQAVERTMKEVAIKRRGISGPMGQVTLRCNLDDPTNTISVRLFGTAVHLEAA